MTTHRLLWISSAAGILLTLSSTANAQFVQAPGSPFPAGLAPSFVAAADFNGDGKQDLAIADQNEDTVTILLGNGTGSFTAAAGSPYATGFQPRGLVVADFNGDGKPDLAVANVAGNDVTVILGDGTGAFTSAPGSPFATGVEPFSLAVGDFNGDGKLDLAVANSNTDNITVLLGLGTGGFTAATGSPFATGAHPVSVAVGDFNGDNKPDLAIANGGSGGTNVISILLGDGTGGFTSAGTPVPVGTNPTSLVVADFNSDGKPDVAVANAGSSDITVLLGNGTGGFTTGQGSPYSAGTVPVALVLADFNGDGKPDLATANAGSNNLTLLLGNGTGTFTAAPSSSFPVGSFPSWVAVADFNSDGKEDLAITNALDNSGTILLNITPNAHLIWQNETTRQVTVNYFGGLESAIFTGWNWLNIGGIPGWHVAAVADFDGDGTADLVWQNDTTAQVTVNYYGGVGGAVFKDWCYLNAGSNVGWEVVGAADFDGNGVPDLIWMNQATRQVTVNYYGGSQGCTLLDWNWLNASGEPGWTVVGAADYDNNGVPDLIWLNDATRQVTVNYYGGLGGATLIGWNWLNPTGFPGWTLTGAADFDGNTVPDLIWQNDTSGQVTVNYYGGPGGLSLIGWNWLNVIGVPGWRAFPSMKP